MNFKNKFNALIDYIEENIQLNTVELMKLIRAEFAYGDAAYLNHAFEYITGFRLKEYISNRKLLHIWKYIKDNSCTIENAALEFNYSAATNYMKDFKNKFGTTVNKMKREEFQTLFKPLYIENILSDKEENEVVHYTYKPEHIIFDLPVSQFNSIKKAIDLMEFYDFDQQQADFAFCLSKKLSFEIDEIFSFCADYFDHQEYIKKRYGKIKIENLAVVCKKTDVCVRQGVEMMKKIDEELSVKDYKDIPEEAWTLINDDTLNFDYQQFPQLAIYIVQKMQELKIPLSELDSVMGELDVCGDIDEAIENYKNGKSVYDDFSDIDMDMQKRLEELDKEFAEIEATYTKGFLGY